jgi:thymidylate synthase (FAD)
MRPFVYYAPQVTVLSAPSFAQPEHLPVTFVDPGTPIEQLSEYAGRICYMSQANPANRTTAQYLAHILEAQHGSVLEHGMFSYLLEGVSRSLTHELIRHRVGTAVSQLSQRFVDESETAFVCPPEIAREPRIEARWLSACEHALTEYKALCANLDEQHSGSDVPKTLRRKRVREAARAVLPNCVETKLVWSCNLRELRHILLLRGSIHADLEFQELAKALLAVTRPLAPGALADLAWSPAQGITSNMSPPPPSV